ncbi:MAG TPA: alpha/beta fold hydrolase [Tabrizicola sp.]
MTPLVLMPGMMCDARMWGGIDRGLGVPVIHHNPTDAEAMSDLAALFLADAPPQFALAGLSMGGILAMEVLRQAPHRVTRLALLDTNPRAETAAVRACRGPQIERALAGDLEGVMRTDMKPNYLAPGPNQAAILDLCMDMALTLGPQVFARQSRALRDRPDQQATLAGFNGPALVLMGAEDKLCPLDRHQLMHDLMPQSRLHIVPGAAHLPPLEQPDATLRAMRDWLA